MRTKVSGGREGRRRERKDTDDSRMSN